MRWRLPRRAPDDGRARAEPADCQCKIDQAQMPTLVFHFEALLTSQPAHFRAFGQAHTARCTLLRARTEHPPRLSSCAMCRSSCAGARGGRSSSCESSARLHHSRTGCCRCPVEPVQPCPAAAWPLVFSAVQFQQGVVWGAQVPFLAFLLPRALAGGHRHAPRDRARVRRAAPTTIATVSVGLRLAAGPYRRAAPLGTSIITCHSCASIGDPPSSRSLGHSRSYCCSTDGFSALCTRAQMQVRHGVCCALKHLQPAYWCAG